MTDREAIVALRKTLLAVIQHFSSVMGGPLIAGAGITFKNGVEGIPTIKEAREVLNATAPNDDTA